MKLEKIKRYENEFYKKYSLELDYECVEFLKDMQKSEFEFKNVTLYEDVERDMQSVEGTYSTEDLISNYDYYMSRAAIEGKTRISAFGQFKSERILIQLYPREKTVLFVTENESLELDDVVKKQV